jgi:hypothetical protein
MLPLTAPEAFFGIVQLHPDTDRGAVAPTLAERRPDTLQVNELLPDELLDAAADAVRDFPEICLRVYRRRVDPTLASLARFEHAHCLSLDVPEVMTFDAPASFRKLARLGLGETTSRKPSLTFLREPPRLWWLGVSGNWKDFETVGDGRTSGLCCRTVRTSTNASPMRLP